MHYLTATGSIEKNWSAAIISFPRDVFLQWSAGSTSGTEAPVPLIRHFLPFSNWRYMTLFEIYKEVTFCFFSAHLVSFHWLSTCSSLHFFLSPIIPFPVINKGWLLYPVQVTPTLTVLVLRYVYYHKDFILFLGNEKKMERRCARRAWTSCHPSLAFVTLQTTIIFHLQEEIGK